MSERLTIQYIDELLCSWNRETYTKDSIYLGSTFAGKEKKKFQGEITILPKHSPLFWSRPS